MHRIDSADLKTVEVSIHTLLDLYAFIALAPSSSTVDGLIQMVKSDNDLRQQEMDEAGHARDRLLNVRTYVVTISLDLYHRYAPGRSWRVPMKGCSLKRLTHRCSSSGY